MKKAIVTGANGFLGKQLVCELLARNIDVIAIDVKFDRELQENNKVDCINCNNKSPFDLELELKKTSADVFFHFAWVGTSGDIRADYKVQLDNIRLTCDYILLSSKIQCKRFMYASSIGEMETYEYLQSDNVNPTGGNIYGAGKLAAHLMGETIAKLNGVDFIPVIITNIYGVGEKSARLINTSIRKLLNKEHCSFTDGKQTYDFIYITDAIASIIEVADKGKPFTRYYIGSGNPKLLREFLLEMKEIVAPEIEIGLGDLPFNGIDINYNQFKLKKVEEDTGYKNKISFSDGIKMTMDFIKKENDNNLK